MKLFKCILVFIAGILMFNQIAKAASIDELLLDRLVSKGVITQDEAAGIRAETAIKTQEENSQKNIFSLEGNTKFGLSGYLQSQYLVDQTAGVCDAFKIRRARLDFHGEVSKKVGWRMQLDTVQPLKSVVTSVSQNGTTKNVTVKTTNAVTRPVLLDANIDYKLYPSVNFGVGQFYLPFGRENTTSDALLDTINRSQVTEKLVPGRDIGSQGRDIGLQVGGTYDFRTGNKIIEYAAGIFNGAGINIDDENEHKDFSGRLLVFPVKGLSAGISSYIGKSSSTEIDKIRTGAEISYIFQNMSLKAEYVSGNDGSTDKYGWYIQAGYRFIQQIEALLKYDSYDPDNNTNGDRSDITTFGLNWYMNKNAKIQANYELKNEELTHVDNDDLIIQFQIMF